ncbi:microprocessor complex subunit DGCR8-like [Planococcus citri]|uniref:microprocessor complex subunit DGCR8-like n=1 Tax=Planococcus citri TaxID=170843 RepID=UPI0031F95362
MSDDGKEDTEQTFFNVIDSIEDQFDDSDDEELHVSSDHSSVTSEQVKLVYTSSDSEDDTQKDFNPERISTYYPLVDEPPCIIEQECKDSAEPGEDTNECQVVEQPKELNEKSPLPEGWKEIFHESGVPLYTHIETNVCSLSRPYFIGTGSTKSHILPETAVPCMYEKTIRNPESFEEENTEEVVEVASRSDTFTRPKQARISNYCKRLFQFTKIKYLKFRSWDVRRTYLRTLRNERNRRKRPFSDKLITFPIVKKNEEGKIISIKKWVINPRGKSYVAILHEYLQQSLKTQPVYAFSEVDNARTPYAATVIVNGDEYGSGVGMSKREAKLEAAKATLLVLLPKMKKSIMKVCEKQKKTTTERSDSEEEQNIASVFDDIEITDPRVSKLSKKTTEPTPYELLMKCVQRKSDSQLVQINYNVESNEYTMTLGTHSVTVKCTNKRDGKQQASQALLQALHPYINNWGSLLRLYCNRTTDHYLLGPRNTTEDADIEETKHRSPNTSLLNTLRERMLRLSEKEKRRSSAQ